MGQTRSLEERISAHYTDLSEQLRKAADFVLINPVDVASRDLRSLAQKANVSPSAFSRLAGALGYDSFKNIKDLTRQSVEATIPSFARKAEQLRDISHGDENLLDLQSAACIDNIRLLS